MNQSSEQEHLLQLIREAQEGSHAAFSELFSAFQPLIWSLVKNFAYTADDEPDLYQEATLAFYRAVMDYQMSPESAGFARFAKICMTNRLIDCCRKMASARKIEVSTESGGEAEEIPDETQNPSLHVMEEESYLALCRKIRSVLSNEENEVWTLHFAGYSAMEIAKKIGKCPKSVENSLFRVRRKLRKVFEVK